MRLNNDISGKNIWKNFKKEELQGWLVYTLHTTQIDTPKDHLKIHIDGNEFHNTDGFYCALGEEVNGPGGYFGRQLYALDDCLYGGFGVKSVSEFVWSNHKRSKKLLKSEFNKIIRIFENHRIRVILS